MAQEHEIDVELVVVRHGETESNRTHTIQGHLNTPLSDVGLLQAERLAKHIGKILLGTYLKTKCSEIENAEIKLCCITNIDSLSFVCHFFSFYVNNVLSWL